MCQQFLTSFQGAPKRQGLHFANRPTKQCKIPGAVVSPEKKFFIPCSIVVFHFVTLLSFFCASSSTILGRALLLFEGPFEHVVWCSSSSMPSRICPWLHCGAYITSVWNYAMKSIQHQQRVCGHTNALMQQAQKRYVPPSHSPSGLCTDPACRGAGFKSCCTRFSTYLALVNLMEKLFFHAQTKPGTRRQNTEVPSKRCWNSKLQSASTASQV